MRKGTVLPAMRHSQFGNGVFEGASRQPCPDEDGFPSRVRAQDDGVADHGESDSQQRRAAGAANYRGHHRDIDSEKHYPDVHEMPEDS